MNREEAIEYLKRKKQEADENRIERVMKEGKIYGDPVAHVQ